MTLSYPNAFMKEGTHSVRHYRGRGELLLVGPMRLPCLAEETCLEHLERFPAFLVFDLKWLRFEM